MPRKRSHILLHVVPFQLAIFGLILIGISDLLPHIDATSDLITNSTGVLPRNKRQYYGDDVYGSYYGWLVLEIVMHMHYKYGYSVGSLGKPGES